MLNLLSGPGISLDKKVVKNDRALRYLKDPKINTITPYYIIQLLTQESLLKLQDFMKKHRTLKITEFIRFFKTILPVDANDSDENQFFITYALFKIFQEICNRYKKMEVTFSQISSFIAEKMPTFTQQHKIQQKLLPKGIDFDESHKKQIVPPQVYGQALQERIHFIQRPIRSDKIQHLNRDVGQSEYSKKFKMFFTMDRPSPIISVLDHEFNHIISLKTEQDMSKRDMIVTHIAWSDREQKIACLLGNYSISMWSKQDNFKYEVNVPLPPQYLRNPYTMIKYMESMKKWITVDNRPAIYILNHSHYEPEYVFNNTKIRKKKQSQRIILQQLEYVQLLCIGFQRNLFLVSLVNKQIVSELYNFQTSITSITFSEAYQALFVSTYDDYFRSYELSQFGDLMERGKFIGHKSQISLVGNVENKPIVFSVQDNSICKLFDMRDYSCFQSFSVLKNIVYKQILYMEDAICLVGSKMHVYGMQKQYTYEDPQHIIYISNINKDIMVVSNKSVRVYDGRNGILTTVIKAIFGNEGPTDIFSAYLIPNRNKLAINNEEGQCVILETKQMSEIAVWNVDPKPFSMHYDEENQLITQVSLGDINICQYEDLYCRRELRRKIINYQFPIRYIKISEKHDLIVVAYDAEGDDNIYFYAYEKGKILGFLNFGKGEKIKFKNAYLPHKNIPKIVQVQFIQNKNGILILLKDEFIFLTYKKSSTSMTFMMKRRIKLWQLPMSLVNHQEKYKYQEQQPLHSCGMAIFDEQVIMISNQAGVFAIFQNLLSDISIDTCVINRQNYNPYRIGTESHNEIVDLRNPMVTINDYKKGEQEDLKYYKHPQKINSSKDKIGKYVLSKKLGNLIAIADSYLNIIFFQYPDWNKIAGIINLGYTLPKHWNVFKFSDKQVKEVEFVMNFIENQDKIMQNSTGSIIRSLVEMHSGNSNQTLRNPKLSSITISQLIMEDQEKNKFSNLKSYRSCSLREKKMVLEKQRDQKQKLQNFEEHNKLREKNKVQKNPALNAGVQKQINDTLGYLSLNYNETILKKGIIQEQIPAVKQLQKKIDKVINKDEKKSLFSGGGQSISKKKVDNQNKLEKVSKNLLASQASYELKPFNNNISKISRSNSHHQFQHIKTTNSSQIFDELTEKLGLKKYNSRTLLEKLKVQRSMSQKKIISQSKGFDSRKVPNFQNSGSLPKLNKK